jgi:hypothetical protein
MVEAIRDDIDARVRHLAATNVDPLPWIRAALDHGLEWQMLPLVQKTLEADEIPEDLLARLLKSSQARPGGIRLAMGYGAGRGLESVVAAMTPSDFDRHMWTAFVRVTPQALKLLKSHPDRLVAALAITCWAGWYDYPNRHNEEETDQTDAQLAVLTGWTEAMLDLEVPNQLGEYALERGLVSLARTSPDNFTQLFIRHVNKEKYPINDFDEWASAAQTLDHDHKTATWRQLKGHPCKREVFWVLAGKDTRWIGDRLDDGSVADPSELLGHVGFRPTDRPPIEEIAALFANRAGPELILASLPATLSGDDVEVAQYRLGESQKLPSPTTPTCGPSARPVSTSTRRSSRPRRRRLANTNSAARSGTSGTEANPHQSRSEWSCRLIRLARTSPSDRCQRRPSKSARCAVGRGGPGPAAQAR